MGVYQHINSPADVKALLVLGRRGLDATRRIPRAPHPHRVRAGAPLPGALQEFDHVSDIVDRAWILHHRHFFHHRLSQRRKIPLFHPHVA